MFITLTLALTLALNLTELRLSVATRLRYNLPVNMPGAKPFAKFGSDIPYAEPGWYQGQASPYYTESHVAFRAKVPFLT